MQPVQAVWASIVIIKMEPGSWKSKDFKKNKFVARDPNDPTKEIETQDFSNKFCLGQKAVSGRYRKNFDLIKWREDWSDCT